MSRAHEAVEGARFHGTGEPGGEQTSRAACASSGSFADTLVTGPNSVPISAVNEVDSDAAGNNH